MRRRTFNMPRAKRAIMGVSGGVLGLWSALTGIAPQSAADPYLTFMLGFAAPKSAATASVFAFWVSVFAAGSWAILGNNGLAFGLVLLVAFGATVGVIAAAPVVPRFRSARRIGQTLITFLCVYVIMEGVRHRFGGPSTVPWEILRGPLGWVLIGFTVGAVGQILAIPTGVLLVPALVYGAGLAAGPAIMNALAVAVVAAVLPVAGHMLRGLADREIAPAMHAGGIVGAIGGGWIMAMWAQAPLTWPLAVFGTSAMILCAWLAYRSA